MHRSLAEKPVESIRKATPRDAEALRAISRETFVAAFAGLYSPTDLDAFLAYAYAETERELADPAVRAWLMEADGLVIGYAVAGPCDLENEAVTPACGELKRLYLLPAWHGGGRGSRLLATALGWLERDGARRIWIGVFSGNLAAQRLYARHGFEKVGEHTFTVGSQVDREFTLRRG